MEGFRLKAKPILAHVQVEGVGDRSPPDSKRWAWISNGRGWASHSPFPW